MRVRRTAGSSSGTGPVESRSSGPGRHPCVWAAAGSACCGCFPSSSWVWSSQSQWRSNCAPMRGCSPSSGSIPAHRRTTSLQSIPGSLGGCAGSTSSTSSSCCSSSGPACRFLLTIHACTSTPAVARVPSGFDCGGPFPQTGWTRTRPTRRGLPKMTRWLCPGGSASRGFGTPSGWLAGGISASTCCGLSTG